MAYGNPVSVVDFGPVVVVKVNSLVDTANHGNDFSSTTTNTFTSQFPFKLSVVRTGDNSVGVRTPLRTPPPRLVKYSYLRKVGRLKKAVDNPLVGRKTKTVYVLEQGTHKRISKQRYTTKYRKPNKLFYEKVDFEETGARTAVSQYQTFSNGLSATYSRTYTGSLWTPFTFIGGGVSGVNPADYLAPQARFETARLRLQNELLARYSDHVAGVKAGLGQMLAERKQAISLFTDAIKRLCGTYAAIRKGNLGLAAERLLPGSSSSLARDRLAYSFGLQPLIQDIKNCKEVLGEGLSFAANFRSRKFVALPEEKIADSTSNGVRSIVTEGGVVEIKYQIESEMFSPGLHIATELGFGPLSLLWELTPWSFVADWVFPIGDAISQAEALASVTPTKIVRTTTIKRRVQIIKHFTGSSGLYKWDGSKNVLYIHHVSVKREILASLPSVDITVMQDDPINLSRVLNSLALLRQTFRK